MSFKQLSPLIYKDSMRDLIYNDTGLLNCSLQPYKGEITPAIEDL